MKKYYLILSLLLSTIAFAQEWKTNMTEARKEATTTNKNVLLVFSGSDWCAPCMKLEKNIWTSAPFSVDATNWVLVKADFPKKKSAQLSPELQEQNNKLAELYNPEGHFPLVVVLDQNGHVLGKTGFKNSTPEEYIALLHSFEKKI